MSFKDPERIERNRRLADRQFHEIVDRTVAMLRAKIESDARREKGEAFMRAHPRKGA